MSVHPLHPAGSRTDPECCPGFITDLVVRCGTGTGDDVALGELFDLVHPLVGAIVCNGRPPTAETDDQVVAVFVRIWHEAPGYDPHDPMSRGVVAWLGEQALAVVGRPVAGPPVVLAG